MTHALVAATFGGFAATGGVAPLVGHVLFGLGAAVLIAAVIILMRAPEGPTRYAGIRRR